MTALLFRACALVALLAHAALAPAQTWPDRPVRLLVGGGPDVLARLVAERLSATWGQAVFVEQKPAANGVIAADTVAKGPADGYNWLLSSGGYTSNQVLQPKLPYDLTRDLEPVTMIATLPFVLIVNADLPVKNVQELVALAKTQPGKLNFASGGTGGPGHLAGEMLKQKAHIDVVHVAYRGVAPAVMDVMGGKVQWSFTPAPSALALIKSGKLRAIAVAGPARYAGLPDVPTVAEQGYPDFKLVGWNGLHVAAKTPPAIVNKIAADVAKIMATPEARAKAEAAGFEPVSMTRPEFEGFVRNELATFAEIVKVGNIKVSD